ncbi:MAG: TrkA family potassium uptake protein [Anaerolineae bacterium]|nr:TrkA family potassium uptake protein [Anaerolineae bacterium]
MNVLIVGGGKVGQGLAETLVRDGHSVTVIENRAEQVATLRHDLTGLTVVVGSGTDPAALEAAGVRQAHVVAAVTGADETNLVVTNLARLEYHAPRVIARVNNPKNAWLFTPDMGVDVAVNQAALIASLIAEQAEERIG